MYCQNCGEPIEDDSIFCKHCGAKVSENKSIESASIIPTRIHSLTRIQQIFILLYCIWLIIMLSLWINDDDDFEGFQFFILAIAIPLVCLLIWCTIKIIITAIKTKKEIISSTPLSDFGNRYGKMKIISMNNPVSEQVDSYCTFTSIDGNSIRVDFSERTKEYDSDKILMMRPKLVVNQLKNGAYILDVNGSEK